jgi:hypothetical protein
MKRMQNRLAVAALSIGSVAMSALAMADDVSWFTVDGGGNTSSGGGFALSGTIGQPDAGMAMTGDGFELFGGFWVGAAAPGGSLPGDCNDDGSVDLLDYIQFASCLLGPGVPADPECACADLDQDGMVTVLDFAIFQVNFATD